MYISDVRIINYRNFSDFKVSLNEGLSIIIGENNGGKSNFLEALNLIFNNNYSLRKRTLEQEDFWNGVAIKDTWPEIVIEAIIKGINSEDELAITSRWLTRTPSEAKLTYKFRPKVGIRTIAPSDPTSISKIRLPIEEYEWVIYGGEQETLDAFDFNMLNKFGVEYVGALRDATTDLKKSSGQLHRILKHYDIAEKDLEQIADKLDKLNEQIEKGKEINAVQTSINTYLEKITGVTKQQVKIKMGESDYDTLLKDLKLSIGLNEDELHSVEKNGLGYNNLLYISLLLSQYTIVKEKKASKHDYLFPILIVEEPEAHLHSHLQKFLANYFFKQKVIGQVIMTTHSSHVSSHGELDNLILFYKNKGNTLSRRIGTIFDERKKEQREHKRYLERWLDATKSNIFFGRKVLLVEGIAERLLIPKFFQMIYEGKTLEGENISIISVDGVAFRPFLHLFNPLALDMKCAVLTDSDPAKVPVLNSSNQEVRDRNGDVIKEAVYPVRKEDCIVCDRTQGLIDDFNSLANIQIFNNLKTFEYDLMLENNTAFFKELILKHNVGTKADRESVAELEEVVFAKKAYEIISNEKGDFSQLILDELNEGGIFNIPSYIKDAFEFLMKEEE
ncbi:ATP-dependent nuclease [Bacillus thuringiensis]|uniref:ATP-dependent nuclease n=1 Tax=Bacillus thuringiensis TaxID=1428 RepID=UPI0008BAAF6B|nr:AAA family ATPase [Bacillus thuringiensis]SEJ69654.1 AAA ATPase domain-containing protein [Bacillus thuringiensis]